MCKLYLITARKSKDSILLVVGNDDNVNDIDRGQNSMAWWLRTSISGTVWFVGYTRHIIVSTYAKLIIDDEIMIKRDVVASLEKKDAEYSRTWLNIIGDRHWLPRKFCNTWYTNWNKSKNVCTNSSCFFFMKISALGSSLELDKRSFSFIKLGLFILFLALSSLNSFKFILKNRK